MASDVTLALLINFDKNPITRYVEELTNRDLYHIHIHHIVPFHSGQHGALGHRSQGTKVPGKIGP